MYTYIYKYIQILVGVDLELVKSFGELVSENHEPFHLRLGCIMVWGLEVQVQGVEFRV